MNNCDPSWLSYNSTMCTRQYPFSEPFIRNSFYCKKLHVNVHILTFNVGNSRNPHMRVSIHTKAIIDIGYEFTRASYSSSFICDAMLTSLMFEVFIIYKYYIKCINFLIV
jgi:hypothetical protein